MQRAAGDSVSTVLAPRPGTLDWQRYRACDVEDAELFWPKRGGSGMKAKALCAKCPVRVLCLRYALENHEESGVWGGVGGRDRRKLKKLQHLSDEELEALTAIKAKPIPEVRPMSPRRSPKIQPRTDGKKECSTCGEVKDLDEFHRNRNKRDGHHSTCAKCTSRIRNKVPTRRPSSITARLREERRAS